MLVQFKGIYTHDLKKALPGIFQNGTEPGSIGFNPQRSSGPQKWAEAEENAKFLYF